MNLNVIYPRVCGVDVHKKFIVAVICITESDKPLYKRKRFSTFHNSLIKFREWLLENGCQNVCMESTGKYYVPVYNALEGHISNIVVANPKWVRAVKNEKDDNKDAKWIADLFKLGIVKKSYIPEKNIRILRELSRYLVKLTNMRSSEKNRYQNALTTGNCKADIVFSDVFGKSASSIIELILSEESYSDEDILSKKHHRCQASDEDILNAFSGVDFTPAQKERIKIIKEHMDTLDQKIARLKAIIDSLCEAYEVFIDLLCTVPGIRRYTAISIISEIGIDMDQFSSPKQLTAWAGLTPGHNESAGKKKSVRITRAGVYLKPYLVEAAHAAIKDKEHPYYANKFNKISKRRGKKRAIIAIARKILVAIYHIIKTGELWNPADLADIETPVETRVKYLKNNLKSTLKELLNNGITLDQIRELLPSESDSIISIPAPIN